MKRRRRWPWVVLAAVLVLVGGTIAWQNRPLNATERELVGHWRCKSRSLTCSFAANRRFQFDDTDVNAIPFEGRWSATDSSLVLWLDIDPELPLPTRVHSFAARLFRPVTTTVHWRGPDHSKAFGDEHFRVSPEEAARSSINSPLE
jgi:hypothetical protein